MREQKRVIAFGTHDAKGLYLIIVQASLLASRLVLSAAISPASRWTPGLCKGRS